MSSTRTRTRWVRLSIGEIHYTQNSIACVFSGLNDRPYSERGIVLLRDHFRTLASPDDWFDKTRAHIT
ncbi:unnamed protein product, partial [Amoebophrya sp. A25]|eukprot:GSA25T00014842001.1